MDQIPAGGAEAGGRSGTRDARFEFMRVLCMLLIVVGHSITHSDLADWVQPGSGNYFIMWFVRCLCRVSVPGFVMLTGYFQCRQGFRLRKLAMFLLTVLFYSIINYIVGVTAGRWELTAEYVLWALFPVMSKVYWFPASYAMLLVLSPLLNRAVGAMDRQTHLLVLAGLGLVFTVLAVLMKWAADFSAVNGGFSPMYFLYLYLVGAYLRLYPPRRETSWVRWGLLTLAAAAITSLLVELMETLFRLGGVTAVSPYLLYDLNAFPTVIASVLFFRMILALPPLPRRLGDLSLRLGGLVFGVYLLHDNFFVRHMMWTEWIGLQRLADRWVLWPAMLAAALGIFLGGVGVEYLRQRLTARLGIDGAVARLCARLEDRAYRQAARLTAEE